MDREMAMVKEFHAVRGVKDGNSLISCSCKLDRTDSAVTAKLALTCTTVAAIADQLKKHGVEATKEGDPRLLRAHLVLEEAAELVEAMLMRDEVKTADALADLAYVTFGTALAFGIPLGDVFHEVHAANMRKRASKDDPRAQDKGAGWQPPNVTAAIDRGRERLQSSGLLD